MIQPGKYITLKVGQPTQGGVLLTDAQGGAVLLPESEYENEPVSGRYLPVFVYQNNDTVLVATLTKPKVVLGEAAVLTIKSVTQSGAFADWGLPKDVFIPFKEQGVKMEEGERYVIALYYDEASGRLAGSSRINRYLDNANHDLEEGMEVDLIIADKSDLGVNVVINNKYLGLVYHNEFFKNVGYGDTTKGWIKALRPNNKIDVSLQRAGHQAVHDSTDVILTALENNRGFLGLTDNSSPEDIKAALGMSKKLFKKTIGQLYRQRVISLHEDGIRLAEGE